jgi:hypothetical protein
LTPFFDKLLGKSGDALDWSASDVKLTLTTTDLTPDTSPDANVGDCICSATAQVSGGYPGWGVELCTFHDAQLRNKTVRAFVVCAKGAFEVVAPSEGAYAWAPGIVPPRPDPNGSAGSADVVVVEGGSRTK